MNRVGDDISAAYEQGYADGYKDKWREIILCNSCKFGDHGKIFDEECVWCRLDHNPKPITHFCGFAKKPEPVSEV